MIGNLFNGHEITMQGVFTKNSLNKSDQYFLKSENKNA